MAFDRNNSVNISALAPSYPSGVTGVYSNDFSVLKLVDGKIEGHLLHYGSTEAASTDGNGNPLPAQDYRKTTADYYTHHAISSAGPIYKVCPYTDHFILLTSTGNNTQAWLLNNTNRSIVKVFGDSTTAYSIKLFVKLSLSDKIYLCWFENKTVQIIFHGTDITGAQRDYLALDNSSGTTNNINRINYSASIETKWTNVTHVHFPQETVSSLNGPWKTDMGFFIVQQKTIKYIRGPDYDWGMTIQIPTWIPVLTIEDPSGADVIDLQTNITSSPTLSSDGFGICVTALFNNKKCRSEKVFAGRVSKTTAWDPSGSTLTDVDFIRTTDQCTLIVHKLNGFTEFTTVGLELQKFEHNTLNTKQIKDVFSLSRSSWCIIYNDGTSGYYGEHQAFSNGPWPTDTNFVSAISHPTNTAIYMLMKDDGTAKYVTATHWVFGALAVPAGFDLVKWKAMYAGAMGFFGITEDNKVVSISVQNDGNWGGTQRIQDPLGVGNATHDWFPTNTLADLSNPNNNDIVALCCSEYFCVLIKLNGGITYWGVPLPNVPNSTVLHFENTHPITTYGYTSNRNFTLSDYDVNKRGSLQYLNDYEINFDQVPPIFLMINGNVYAENIIMSFDDVSGLNIKVEIDLVEENTIIDPSLEVRREFSIIYDVSLNSKYKYIEPSGNMDISGANWFGTNWLVASSGGVQHLYLSDSRFTLDAIDISFNPRDVSENIYEIKMDNEILDVNNPVIDFVERSYHANSANLDVSKVDKVKGLINVLDNGTIPRPVTMISTYNIYEPTSSRDNIHTHFTSEAFRPYNYEIQFPNFEFDDCSRNQPFNSSKNKQGNNTLEQVFGNYWDQEYVSSTKNTLNIFNLITFHSEEIKYADPSNNESNFSLYMKKLLSEKLLLDLSYTTLLSNISNASTSIENARKDIHTDEAKIAEIDVSINIIENTYQAAVNNYNNLYLEEENRTQELLSKTIDLYNNKENEISLLQSEIALLDTNLMEYDNELQNIDPIHDASLNITTDISAVDIDNSSNLVGQKYPTLAEKDLAKSYLAARKAKEALNAKILIINANWNNTIDDVSGDIHILYDNCANVMTSIMTFLPVSDVSQNTIMSDYSGIFTQLLMRDASNNTALNTRNNAIGDASTLLPANSFVAIKAGLNTYISNNEQIITSKTASLITYNNTVRTMITNSSVDLIPLGEIFYLKNPVNVDFSITDVNGVEKHLYKCDNVYGGFRNK